MITGPWLCPHCTPTYRLISIFFFVFSQRIILCSKWSRTIYSLQHFFFIILVAYFLVKIGGWSSKGGTISIWYIKITLTTPLYLSPTLTSPSGWQAKRFSHLWIFFFWFFFFQKNLSSNSRPLTNKKTSQWSPLLLEFYDVLFNFYISISIHPPSSLFFKYIYSIELINFFFFISTLIRM